MKQWHCSVDGQQYGPADEFLVEQWIAEGRVTPETYVWTEGMGDWVRAAAVLPELFGEFDGVSVLSMVESKPLGGTGGHTSNKELMRRAREALAGKWGTAVGFSFLVGLMTMVISMIPFIGSTISMVIGGAFELAVVIFYLTLVRRGQADTGLMFKGFENFGNSLGAYLLRQVFVMLWMLLFIIPGFIAAYSYAMAMYMIAEDKSLGPLEAIRKSKVMMDGHKGRLFCLNCRFIGWSLLCILTLGIGLLWLIPYAATSQAMFYEDLKNGTASPMQAAVPEAVAPVAATPEGEMNVPDWYKEDAAKETNPYAGQDDTQA